MDNRKHYTAAISAFIIWGFIAIPLRALSQYSPGEILYFRILFSALVLCVVVFAFRRKGLKEAVIRVKSLPSKERFSAIALTLVGGLLLSINWLTFIHIVNHINIKTASFSYLVCPVMTAALGYFVIGEKMSTLQWVAVTLCALSCVLIGLNSALELGYSFLTALTYALYLISQRKNQGFDRMVVLGVQVAFSLIVLTLLSGTLVHKIPVAGSFYLIIGSIAVVFTVLPLFLNLVALNRIKSSTIGILMYINPIINFVMAFLVFNESVTTAQFTGYAIIFVALIIFNYAYLKMLAPQLTRVENK